ncbi:phage virion morphogenesis protein [Novosphingopyxis sp. YJ-S2-01]|uniref:phage virion morphogenesis protein n=1 Tax=Novosphingopyxis sp. YJ-S2-01 TaxID=2794021 RepID=UPI0018DD56DF|nr:phage virion morphogenesis protein [Novosphingopyxis sp. YJ-S2-01]MBH9537893.1 phage virion morphogenesis protein [Novosphingopyxis sp. YJ-S2-01]
MSDNLDAELARMERWIGGLIAALGSGPRRKAAGKIANAIRGSQAKRIAAQRNTDGTPFAPRRKAAGPPVVNRAVSFLYPEGGSGKPRKVTMKSWKKDGGLMTGYDIEAGGIRSFERVAIIRFLPVDQATANRSAPRPSGRATVRQRQMFRGLRTYRLLHRKWSAEDVEIGFDGASGRIASIHQDGLFEKSTPSSPAVRYPTRQLLGLTGLDEARISEIMFDMLVGSATL